MNHQTSPSPLRCSTGGAAAAASSPSVLRLCILSFIGSTHSHAPPLRFLLSISVSDESHCPEPIYPLSSQYHQRIRNTLPCLNLFWRNSDEDEQVLKTRALLKIVSYNYFGFPICRKCGTIYSREYCSTC